MAYISKSYSDFYLCQGTHNYRKDAELGMGVGTCDPITCNPWWQLTVWHPVQVDTSETLQNSLLYSVTWVLAKDNVQLLVSFKHFLKQKMCLCFQRAASSKKNSQSTKP